MSYRYIAIMKEESWDGDVDPGMENILRSLGMRTCYRHGPITLFTSKETPVLLLPGGGAVVGHLFNHDGTLVGHDTDVPGLPHGSQLGKYLSEHCWGEYLCIQPMAEQRRSWKVIRDPSGGVPCVYSLRDAVGFFTSDISIATRLGLHDPQINWDYLSFRLLYPYKTGSTGLANVRELLPGCSICGYGTHATTKLEWTPWRFVEAENRYDEPEAAATNVRRAIESAVKAWAEVDRSILLELSGGLDSSIVAACLKGTQAQVACCTLVTRAPGTDERHYAALMANQLGVALEVEEMCFEDARFDFKLPSNSVAPSIGALQYATNEAKERVTDRLGTTSNFSGGGGDTILCYVTNAAPAADAFREHGFAEATRAIRDLAELHQCTLWKVARLTARKLRRPPKPPYRADTLFLNAKKAHIAQQAHPWFATPERALDGDMDRIFDLVNTQLFREGAPRSARRPLRMPLLSQPVVEACLRAPSWMWIHKGRNRSIARSAFADVLPREIVDRRSKGSYMNYSGTIYRRSKHRMLDYLLTGRLQAHDLLDAGALRRFVDADLPPRDHSFMRIFDLCMIENWIRQYD